MQEYRLNNSLVDRIVYRTVKPFLIISTSLMMGGYGYFAYELINRNSEAIKAVSKAGIVFGISIASTTSPLAAYSIIVNRRKKIKKKTGIEELVQKAAAQL